MLRKLSEVVPELLSRFPPDETTEVTGYDIDSAKPEGNIVAPRFLFRGEADANWSSTTSSMERMRCSSLPDDAKSEIESITATLDHQLRTMFGLSKPASAGFLQHYGLPSELIDVSSSALVAALFAAWDNFSATGAITVFDTAEVTRYCKLIDLTTIVWAQRPTTQAGYGIFHDKFRNLRQEGIASQIQVAKYEFAVTGPDVVRAVKEASDVCATYIDLRDPGRAIVGHLLTVLCRNDGPFLPAVASYLAGRVPPSEFTVVGFTPTPLTLDIGHRTDLPSSYDPRAISSINILNWLHPSANDKPRRDA
jgi:hypothetical protein